MDFDYTNEKLQVLDDQNLIMCKDAGRIIEETDETVTRRANFSSYSIFLY